jgi:hypothetical protein
MNLLSDMLGESIRVFEHPPQEAAYLDLLQGHILSGSLLGTKGAAHIFSIYSEVIIVWR